MNRASMGAISRDPPFRVEELKAMLVSAASG
jgi:hypothetical protein